jgi:hypothetical protein
MIRKSVTRFPEGDHNLEGLDAHIGADGTTVLTMVSDDNFSIIQRTLLLQFTLVD